jgi:hypothetical protein
LIEQILSYKTLFFNIVPTIGYALSPAMNKSLHAALVNICTSGGGPVFHSSYDGVVARKMSTHSIFHRPEQMGVRRRQIRTVRWVWYDSPANIDSVLHSLQTGLGAGVIVLQEIFQRCLLHFQRIEADIQLRTQFPCRNPPICAYELIETLFVSWCDSCAWPSEAGLSFTSLSPLLKRATHRLNPLTSTVWSP